MIGQNNTSGYLVPLLLVILILMVIWQTTLIQREQEQSRPQFLDRIYILDRIYSEAHFLVRQEAAYAFIELERERGATPNLSEANLSDTNLFFENLEGVDLSGANLRAADLAAANLSGADLSGADLSLANLRRADLSGADLSGADLNPLERTDLPFLAKLVGLVDLTEEKLTDLNSAERMKLHLTAHWGTVTQDQIDSARGDENTRLPEGLNRPEHWLESDRESTRSDEREEDRGRDE